MTCKQVTKGLWLATSYIAPSNNKNKCNGNITNLFKIKAKGQYWPLTCNTNHDTMFDMQEVSIKTNSNMYKPN